MTLPQPLPNIDGLPGWVSSSLWPCHTHPNCRNIFVVLWKNMDTQNLIPCLVKWYSLLWVCMIKFVVVKTGVSMGPLSLYQCYQFWHSFMGELFSYAHSMYWLLAYKCKINHTWMSLFSINKCTNILFLCTSKISAIQILHNTIKRRWTTIKRWKISTSQLTKNVPWILTVQEEHLKRLDAIFHENIWSSPWLWE